MNKTLVNGILKNYLRTTEVKNYSQKQSDLPFLEDEIACAVFTQ